MNICNNTDTFAMPILKQGHLYVWKLNTEEFYLKTLTQLVRISDGYSFEPVDTTNYIDVTDQYCLQKVK